MRNKQGIKIFIVLFLSTTFIFAFSHYGASAFNTVMNNSGTFAEGTMVGNVSIAGQTESEAMQAVDEQLTSWLDGTVVNISFKESNIKLDNALFRFDIADSVISAENGKKNMANAYFEGSSLENKIFKSFSILNDKKIDIGKLKNDLLKIATLLQTGEYEFRLEDYLTDFELNKDVVIQEVKIEAVNDRIDFSRVLKKLSKVGVPANSQISLLEIIKETGLGNESTEALNVITSGIYQLLLPTNFSIIERYISTELPVYAQLGFEAKVDYKNKIDFIFANPNETAYEINIQIQEQNLRFTLMGKTFLNEYSIITKERQSFKPKIIKQYNASLKADEKVVERQGKDGLFIKVFREIYDEKGTLLRSEAISQDFYPPIHQIEVYGLKHISEDKAGSQSETNSQPNEPVDENLQSNPTNLTGSENNEDTLKGIIESNSDLWGKSKEQMK